MYLTAERYLGFKDKLAEKVKANLIFSGLPELEHMEIKRLMYEAIYWRKANAIHKWFVDNVQEGKDDCGRYYVSKENLIELRDLCKRVLQDKDNAQALLPPEEGFFFGGTDIDQYYFDDINHTIESIEKLLAMPFIDDLSFEYHSSW